MAGRMTRLAGLLLVAWAIGSAQAAPFADPTRPPREMQSTTDAPAAAVAAQRLESVLIGPDRRIAVISGQRYTEGARFGDGRVLRINETEVVIRYAARDETLRLFPQGVRRASNDEAK